MRAALLTEPDPYALRDLATNNGRANANPNGRTRVGVALAPGENTKILLFAGQSTISGNCPTPYVPASVKVENFSIYDGGCYVYRDPPLGTSCVMPAPGPGCPIGRIGDKILAQNKAERVITVPICIGGTSIAQWLSDPAIAPRIGVAGRRLAAAGLLSSVTAICWQQGESDQYFGTTQADYASRLAALIAAFRSAGFACPILIAQTTWFGGTTSAAIRTAQAAAVNNATGIYAGPDTDTLTATSRQADNTHWTDAGSDSLASLWVDALTAAGII